MAIVEDDPFARNWMALVAVRDWRNLRKGLYHIKRKPDYDWPCAERRPRGCSRGYGQREEREADD